MFPPSVKGQHYNLCLISLTVRCCQFAYWQYQKARYATPVRLSVGKFPVAHTIAVQPPGNIKPFKSTVMAGWEKMKIGSWQELLGHATQ